jgi:hypothetical protein
MIFSHKGAIMTKTKQEQYTTLDIYLSAYLQLQGLQPSLHRSYNKVIFSFSATHQLYKLLLDYNSNMQVPVADYVITVKALRGQMLELMHAVN